MWYAVNVRVDPGEPVARVTLEGHCLDKSVVQIPLLDASRALLARLPPAPKRSPSLAHADARSSPGTRSTPSVGGGGGVDERTQFEVHLVDATGFLHATGAMSQDAASGTRLLSRTQSFSFAAGRSLDQSGDSATRATDDSNKSSKQNRTSVNCGALTIAEGRDELLRLQYMPTKMGRFRARCASPPSNEHTSRVHSYLLVEHVYRAVHVRV